MKSKKFYERLFSSYSDIVSFNEFCEMLGGISQQAGYRIIREKRINCFKIRTTYHIPKSCVIDYIMSPHYREYQKKLKHHIV